MPATIQEIRKRVILAPTNALSFRTIDKLYPTRTVARAGAVARLSYREAPLDFTYEYGGKAYSPDEFMDRNFTNGLLVMKDGKVVFETYRNMSTDRDRFIGFSMTKSIISVLVGVAIDQGRIASIDDPIEKYLPELKDGGYRGVTIRQILQMRSGIEYDDTPGKPSPPGDPLSAMVDNISRYVDGARDVKRGRRPGEAFEYKNINTQVLGALIERVSGTTISAYASRYLWELLGAESDAFFLMDGPPGVGQEFAAAGFNATMRDWARFGQMMLDGGRVNGRQVVPAAWVAESTAQLGADTENGWGYGYQWWTIPNSDAYAARGLGGQTIFIDPATRTVVVKLSYYPPDLASGSGGPLAAEALAFFKAASAWRPN